MKLQEQINRIQEMMGIINETKDPIIMLRRRMDTLDKHIKSTYQWLNPRAFKDFDDFMERVVFSTTRDFVSEELELTDFRDIMDVRNDIERFVKEYIVDNYMDEIEKYFNHNR